MKNPLGSISEFLPIIITEDAVSQESKRCVTALHQMAKPLETMTASIKAKTVKINAMTASMRADRNELSVPL